MLIGAFWFYISVWNFLTSLYEKFWVLIKYEICLGKFSYESFIGENLLWISELALSLVLHEYILDCLIAMWYCQGFLYSPMTNKFRFVFACLCDSQLCLADVKEANQVDSNFLLKWTHVAFRPLSNLIDTWHSFRIGHCVKKLRW